MSRRAARPGVVDLAAVHVHQRPVTRVHDSGGGKRNDPDPIEIDVGRTRAAVDEHDVGAAPGQRIRDGRGAALMTDAHQVLDPDS